MGLFILTETSAGYAVLKANDKKLLQRSNLAESTETVEGICSLLKLKTFQKFGSAAEAVVEATALTEGKVTPMLASMLDSFKDEKKISLAVADPKLGNAIKKIPSLSIAPISDSTTADLFRAIRTHLPSLIPGLLPTDISTMALGLSHSLSRHKLKFSPDKVDAMIIQAISLLDDLDKELNTYAMRVKEWYGWHFPEMAKIINDNLAYAKVILKMGLRSNASGTDLAEILPDEIEGAVKAAAEISMGTEISPEDLEVIHHLAEQVVQFTAYRAELSSYLSSRMQAIAPNLTALVGDLVGARLISHAGSLMNLAKSPASTIQILGAEKALFRALKTKHFTPKYGLIYHASLIGQATGKNKGKMARMLATKAALGLRVDALSDLNSAEGAPEVSQDERSFMGRESRLRLERQLRRLEGRPLGPRGAEIGPSGQLNARTSTWNIKEARQYNPHADGLTGNEAAGSSRVNGTDGTEGLQLIAQQAGAGAQVDGSDEEEESMMDIEEDEDEEPMLEIEDDEDEDVAEASDAQASGGAKGSSKASDVKLDKASEKEAKRAHKAAKKARKAEKRAAREADEAEAAANGVTEKASKKKKKKHDNEALEESSSKKRKADDAADGGEKKKKKKHKT
ncbi:MAG: Nucleolar protein 58 [Bathelium mastoideum]|nr:MAG: Nucleolar protein 58 [Bathelium mastoideum]